jgi:hypothetical protein
MRIPICLLMIFQFYFASGQQPMDSIYKNYIQISPLTLLDIVNPAIQLSYERKINIRNNMMVEIGYVLPKPIWTNGYCTDMRGIKSKIGYKYFFPKSDYCYFISPEIFFNSFKYTYVNVLDPNDSTHYYIEDTVKVKKITGGFNVVAGIQKVSKRFVFDLFIGLGIKYKSTKYFEKSFIGYELAFPHSPNIDFESNREWTGIRPNVLLNIRIGYAFN